MRPEPETATLHGTRSAHMLFSVWHVSGPELQGMWWPLGKHGRAQHVMLPNSVHHRQFNLMAARVALLLANTNSWLLSWLPAQMARASTVRVVLFDQSPFAAQWNELTRRESHVSTQGRLARVYGRTGASTKATVALDSGSS